MITSKVIYLGNLRTESIHERSGERIISDAPVDNKGRGEAFSPTDLTANSLGSCIITTIGIAAEGRNISIEKMEAEVTKVMASSPRRIAEIHVQLEMKIAPENDTPQTREILKEIGLTCPVARSLHPDIIQDIKFSFL